MSHLKFEDCVLIEHLLTLGYKASQIAIHLEKDPSVVSRELKRYSIGGVYKAHDAWELRKIIRVIANKSHKRIIPDSKLANYILEKIKTYRSPDDIATTRKQATKEKLSKDTIYRFIYEWYPELVKKYFRKQGIPYRKHPKIEAIYGRTFIDDRPQEVAERQRDGDREGDSIEGKGHKGSITTLVERLSSYVQARIHGDRKAHNVTKGIQEMLGHLPKSKRKTLTVDNGKEFADHMTITCITNMDVFFAHPHSPWHKPIIEHANKLFRRFIPKGSCIKSITQEQLDTYVYILNNKPRKRLHYLTPTQVFLNPQLICILN